ncbi:MAG TPA: hypothetical protein VK742_19260 [Candidatus Sulfotelmatobacter sp.]|nr:hypothetical protein [Candidatus Sulfotelmatobacter sp.]
MPKPDPLVGWKVMDIGREREPVNDILKGDYQDFIEKIPPVGPKGSYISPIFIYEDMTGQHAVNFEYFKINRDVWNYYLFYDKNNKRIKVIKYYLGHSSC